MRRTLILAAAIAFLTTFTQPAATQDLASQIVGVWKIVSNHSTEVATGKVNYPFGQNPVGYIVFTKGGREIFTLVGDNRSKPAGAVPTDAERAALFKTLSAGSGSYKVEGNTLIITFDSSWNQNWTGTTQKRKISISGNKLTIIASGQETIFENVLERVE